MKQTNTSLKFPSNNKEPILENLVANKLIKLFIKFLITSGSIPFHFSTIDRLCFIVIRKLFKTRI